MSWKIYQYSQSSNSETIVICWPEEIFRRDTKGDPFLQVFDMTCDIFAMQQSLPLWKLSGPLIKLITNGRQKALFWTRDYHCLFNNGHQWQCIYQNKWKSDNICRSQKCRLGLPGIYLIFAFCNLVVCIWTWTLNFSRSKEQKVWHSNCSNAGVFSPKLFCLLLIFDLNCSRC